MKSMKVIWPVDLSEMESQIKKTPVDTLKTLALSTKVEVQLVHVMDPRNMDTSYEYLAYHLRELERHVQNELTNEKAASFSPVLIPGRIISHTNFSMREGARLLDEFSRETDTDLILLNTRNKTGFPSLTLGSFSENILAESKTPVLVFNQRASPLAQTPINILFPSDFGNHSKDFFNRGLAWAAHLRGDVTVLHKRDKIFGFFPKISDESLRGLQDGLYDLAHKQNVSVKFLTKDSLAPLSQVILDTAQRSHQDLIVLASQSHFLTTPVVGAVVRNVIRQATVPVLSLRREERVRMEEDFVQKYAGASPNINAGALVS